VDRGGAEVPLRVGTRRECRSAGRTQARRCRLRALAPGPAMWSDRGSHRGQRRGGAMSLEGMVFVITGGSSGIGAATAAVAAESGARVVIGSRNAERGNEVVREIAEGGGQAVFQQCDVTVEEDVRTLMETAADAYGGIDVLVCNAGVTDRAVAA